MTQHTPKDCGSCTMCCKLLSVGEEHKPPNVWCEHCDIGAGCRVYETRPASCREFDCLWRRLAMPDELRPDRSRVVLGPTTDAERLVAYVDPDRPDAARSGPMRKLLQTFQTRGVDILVVCGADRTFIPGQGKPIPASLTVVDGTTGETDVLKLKPQS